MPSARLHPGARMPSTRMLAEQFAISRITVLLTYERLIAEGYLQTLPAKGTFVARAERCRGRTGTGPQAATWPDSLRPAAGGTKVGRSARPGEDADRSADGAGSGSAGRTLPCFPPAAGAP